MYCYRHLTLGAVATCSDCGRGLWATWASAITPPTCPNCVLHYVKQRRQDVQKSMALSAGLAIATLLLLGHGLMMGMSSAVTVLFTAYSLACLPFGWRALNRMTPNVFLVLPLLGWLVYFGIKLALAWLVGLVAGPATVVSLQRDPRRVDDVAARSQSLA